MNKSDPVMRWGESSILMKTFGLPILAHLRESGRKSELSIQKYMYSISFLHISRDSIEFLTNMALNRLSTKGYIKQEFYWEITSEGIQYLDENGAAATEWLDAEKIKYETEYQEEIKREEKIREDEAKKAAKKRLVDQEKGRKGKIKGTEGEEKTYNLLLNGKIPGYHRVIKNTFLKGISGRTISEIDALVLSTYGVFVIENKEYNCDIKVSKNHNDVYFIRHKCEKGQKNRKILFNALDQNRKHVNFITSRLHISVKSVYSIIVLPEITKGPNCWESMPHVFVVKRIYLIKKINEVIEDGAPIWSPYEVDKMAEDLLNSGGNKPQNPQELTQEKTRDSIRM